jgi:hypothetical protein
MENALMRCLATAAILSLVSAYGHAAYVTDVDPNDDANWLPVTIEAPPEFGSITSVRVYSVFPDVDGTYGDVRIPTAPYQFWLRRAADSHPGHPIWWLSLAFFLNGSPIGGGQNDITLMRDEGMAPELVLRPKPEFYPPLTPPNDRVDWARFWTVDDGTPRDALVPTDFRLVPEPSSAVMILMGLATSSLRRIRRTGWV